MFMNVGHKNAHLMHLWKSIRLVKPGSHMRRAVAMVSDGADVAIHIWVKMLSALPVIDATRNYMPHMRNNTGTHKKLSFGIIIYTPGIAEAMCYNFKLIFGGMIPPYAPINVYSFSFQNVF